mmetsp:Transcript_52155/g.118909  ORF Transcript_52155/g.118909 Transcript_52155/m.118909 type:complete len:450 (-) Transcript_52155:14-1363(-)
MCPGLRCSVASPALESRGELGDLLVRGLQLSLGRRGARLGKQLGVLGLAFGEVDAPAAGGEGERAHGLVPVAELGRGRDEEHHLSLAVRLQRVLEEQRQLGVAVRDELSTLAASAAAAARARARPRGAGAQRGARVVAVEAKRGGRGALAGERADHVPERAQGLVDGGGLGQLRPLHVAHLGALAASKVNHLELGLGEVSVGRVGCDDTQRDHQVGPRRVVVHVRRRRRAVLRRNAQNLESGGGVGHLERHGSGHGDARRGAYPKVHLGGALFRVWVNQEIPDRFVVDFEDGEENLLDGAGPGDAAVEGRALSGALAGEQGEELVHGAGDHARLPFRRGSRGVDAPPVRAHQSVGLPRARLAVAQHARVEAVEGGDHRGAGALLEHQRLRRAAREDAREGEGTNPLPGHVHDHPPRLEAEEPRPVPAERVPSLAAEPVRFLSRGRPRST